MKQVIQDMRSGETRIEEVPAPIVREGTALVRTGISLVSAGTERMLVEFAGKSLAGKARSRPDLVRQVVDKARREGVLSTLEAAFNRLEQPMALGYSSAGRIVEVGPGLHGFQVGQRVACAGGGYAVHAEYAIIPENLLVALPEEVDFEAAAFTTLGAIAMHGFRLSGAALGESVVIIGLGLLGMLAAQIAQAASCRVLGIDLDERRVQLARKLGFQAVERKQAVEAGQGFTQGRGFDAVIICADTPTSDPVELGGELARQRARVIAVGAVGQALPRKLYYEKELFFANSRSYGPGRYDPDYEEKGRDYPIGYVRWTENRNMEAFVELLQRRAVQVKTLVTHRFPIEQAPQAYRLISEAGGEPFLGVLLVYPDMGDSSDKDILRVVSQKCAPSSDKVTKLDGAGKLRLGLIGAGNFAMGVLLPNLVKLPEIELVGIAATNGANAQKAARRFGFEYAASQSEQILGDPHINTVAILTRHNLHASQTMAGLRSGKHVFCEKPLAIKAGEIDEIQVLLEQLEQVRTSGGDAPLLMVGFNRRFAPLMVRMAAFFAFRNEPLYAHYRVNAGYLPSTHWLQDPEQGGGRLIGEGCHFIDTLTFLVGVPPISVSAQGLPDQARYHEDNVSLTLSFPDGSVGTLAYLANGDKAFPKENLEVFCGGKVAVLDDFRSLKLVQNGRSQVIHSRLRQDKGHRQEWQTFAAAIRDSSPPPIPYSNLLGVSKTALAAVQSLRSGERIEI